MSDELSNTQVDKLGERLKTAEPSPADLQILDQYRRSISKSYEYVTRVIRDRLKLEPTGRPAKSTPSICEKLKRETIRLSQMQDIAGCRILVDDIADQDHKVEMLMAAFDDVSLVDRRQMPSHGYRAVHAIVRHEKNYVEVQIRTKLQHLWSEFSEKLADISDPAVKYGGGPEFVSNLLKKYSKDVERLEAEEVELSNLFLKLTTATSSPNDFVDEVARLKASLEEIKKLLRHTLEGSIKALRKDT